MKDAAMMNIYAKSKLYKSLTMFAMHSCVAACGIVQTQHYPIFEFNEGLDRASMRISSMSTGFGTIAQSIKRYRTYQTTLSELNALGEREVLDLGLNRADFREIARKAAYGR